MKPIMILYEDEKTYQATVNNVSVVVDKDSVIMKDGVKQHPRLEAIKMVAKKAQIQEWVLINI